MEITETDRRISYVWKKYHSRKTMEEMQSILNKINGEIKALQRIKELNNGQKLHRQDRKAEIWERQTRKA